MEQEFKAGRRSDHCKPNAWQQQQQRRQLQLQLQQDHHSHSSQSQSRYQLPLRAWPPPPSPPRFVRALSDEVLPSETLSEVLDRLVATSMAPKELFSAFERSDVPDAIRAIFGMLGKQSTLAGRLLPMFMNAIVAPQLARTDASVERALQVASIAIDSLNLSSFERTYYTSLITISDLVAPIRMLLGSTDPAQYMESTVMLANAIGAPPRVVSIIEVVGKFTLGGQRLQHTLQEREWPSAFGAVVEMLGADSVVALATRKAGDGHRMDVLNALSSPVSLCSKQVEVPLQRLLTELKNDDTHCSGMSHASLTQVADAIQDALYRCESAAATHILDASLRAIEAPTWSVQALGHLLVGNAQGAKTAIEFAAGSSAVEYAAATIAHALNASGIPEVLVQSVADAIADANVTHILSSIATYYRTAANFDLPTWAENAVIALAGAVRPEPSGLAALLPSGAAAALRNALNQYDVRSKLDLSLAVEYDVAIANADASKLGRLLASNSGGTNQPPLALIHVFERLPLTLSAATQLREAVQLRHVPRMISAVIAALGLKDSAIGNTIDTVINIAAVAPMVASVGPVPQWTDLAQIFSMTVRASGLHGWSLKVVDGAFLASHLISGLQGRLSSQDFASSAVHITKALDLPVWIVNGVESILTAAAQLRTLVMSLLNEGPAAAVVQLCGLFGLPEWPVQVIQCIIESDLNCAQRRLQDASGDLQFLLQHVSASDEMDALAIVHADLAGELVEQLLKGDALASIGLICNAIHAPGWAVQAFERLLLGDTESATSIIEGCHQHHCGLPYAYTSLAIERTLTASDIPSAVIEDLMDSILEGNVSHVVHAVVEHYHVDSGYALPAWAHGAFLALTRASHPSTTGLMALLSGDTGKPLRTALGALGVRSRLVSLDPSLGTQYDTALENADVSELGRILATTVMAPSGTINTMPPAGLVRLFAQMPLSVSSAEQLRDALRRGAVSLASRALVGVLGESNTTMGMLLDLIVTTSSLPELLRRSLPTQFSLSGRRELQSQPTMSSLAVADAATSLARALNLGSANYIAKLAPLASILTSVTGALQNGDVAAAATTLAEAAGLYGWKLRAFDALVTAVQSILSGGPLQQAFDALMAGDFRLAVSTAADILKPQAPTYARSLKSAVEISTYLTDSDGDADNSFLGRLALMASNILNAHTHFKQLAAQDMSVMIERSRRQRALSDLASRLGIDAHPSWWSTPWLPDVTINIGCISGSVSPGTSEVPSRSRDRLHVALRLLQLGFSQTGWELSVFQCAISGVTRFEDVCDAGAPPKTCLVSGVNCPPSRKTGRGTCLREDCASQALEPEDKWIRSSGAPGWQMIPAEGPGFRLVEADAQDIWATSWAVDALIAAAANYAASGDQNPMLIQGGSTAAGGYVDCRGDQEQTRRACASVEHAQTGLTIEILLPRNDNSTDRLTSSDERYDDSVAQKQKQALQAAGFKFVFDYDHFRVELLVQPGTSQAKPSWADEKLGSSKIVPRIVDVNFVSELLPPPAQPPLASPPPQSNSSLPSTESQSPQHLPCHGAARFVMRGAHFGSFEDIKSVHVGAANCTPVQSLLGPDGRDDELIFDCDLAGFPLYGHVALQTVWGGLTSSCAPVSYASDCMAAKVQMDHTNATGAARSFVEAARIQVGQLLWNANNLPNNATFTSICNQTTSVLEGLRTLEDMYPNYMIAADQMRRNVQATALFASTRAEWFARCFELYSIRSMLNATTVEATDVALRVQSASDAIEALKSSLVKNGKAEVQLTTRSMITLKGELTWLLDVQGQASRLASVGAATAAAMDVMADASSEGTLDSACDALSTAATDAHMSSLLLPLATVMAPNLIEFKNRALSTLTNASKRVRQMIIDTVGSLKDSVIQAFQRMLSFIKIPPFSDKNGTTADAEVEPVFPFEDLESASSMIAGAVDWGLEYVDKAVDMFEDFVETKTAYLITQLRNSINEATANSPAVRWHTACRTCTCGIPVLPVPWPVQA